VERFEHGQRSGTPIDGSPLQIGDAIFLDFDDHPNRWDHGQFASGRDPGGDGNEWAWAIMHPIHTRGDLYFFPT
jgi:hypothetical protein